MRSTTKNTVYTVKCEHISRIFYQILFYLSPKATFSLSYQDLSRFPSKPLLTIYGRAAKEFFDCTENFNVASFISFKK
jgi:hypothetical protein